MKLNILFFIVSTLLIPIVTYATSFDCTRASTFVEKTICADSKLSLMDEELNILYNEIKTNSLYADQRKQNQLSWLKERNKCNTKVSNEYWKTKCIREAYERRIQDLKKMKDSQQFTFELIDKISFQNYGGLHTTYNNKIIFTNYDSRTKDKYQIIEVDPIDFRLKVLIITKGESTYIAHNKTFIVYKRRGLANTEELIIKNRKTNKTILKKRFSDKIKWGKIVGNDKVLIVQKTEIFIIDLKSLKTIKRHKFEMNSYVRYNKYSSYVLSVAKWKNKVIILTPKNLLIFDENLHEVKEIVLGDSNSNGNLVIYNDKAVVSFDKDVKIFDLNTKKELLSISKPGRFVSYTIMNNLLIVAPQKAGNGVLDAQVYNLSTGKIQATIPLIAQAITYNNKLMLTYDYKYRGKSTFTLYKVDLNSLSSNNVITTQLRKAYKHAQKAFEQTKDFYVSLGILDKAGIEKYLSDNNSILEEEKAIFRQYGIWLSQTLDKYNKTKYVFDTAKINLNDKEVQTALNLARLKACYLMSECSANENDLKQVFGVQDIPSKIISMPMSSIDKLYFIDDKIYVSRYEDGQVGTSIYDTKTLKHVDDIYVYPKDHSDFQDNVTDILDTKNQVILKMFARWNTKRDNFAVINKKDSSLECKGYTTIDLEKLSYDNDNICECFDKNSTCKSKKSEKNSQQGLKKKINHKEEIIGSSSNYIITSTQWSNYTLHFYPINNNIDNEPKQSMRHTTLHIVDGTDQIVYSDWDINSKEDDRVKFSFYNIKTNVNKTLFYEKAIPSYRHPHSVVYKDVLIIGSGYDLFLYNFKKMKFVAYDLNFIPEEISSHIDRNRIDGLYIYKDKLFVKTFNGNNSRVVDLKELEKLQ